MEEVTVKSSFTMPRIALQAISYVNMQAEIGYDRILESLGFPIQKLITDITDAMQGSKLNTFFQVM